jgi:hypothetical protein
VATLGTHDTGRINVRENRKRQSRMDNPEKVATLGTQDTGRINVRKNRIQDKQKKTKRKNIKKNPNIIMSNTDTSKNQGVNSVIVKG